MNYFVYCIPQGGDLGGKFKKMQGKTRDFTHKSVNAAEKAANKASSAAERGTSAATEKGKVRKRKERRTALTMIATFLHQ
eukprot:1156645-Pelagomonas_calceolata.AAC.10